MRGVSGFGRSATSGRRAPRWATTLQIDTGQSLSVGGADPVASTTQPYSNVRLVDSLGIFSGYILSQPFAPTLSLQPLVSPPQAYDNIDGATSFYPKNIGGPGNVAGECVGVRGANQVTHDALALGAPGYVIAACAVGASGQPLAAIQKLTNGNANAYAASTYSCQAVQNLAKATGSFGVGWVTLTHGESDAIGATPLATYQAGLVQLQSDYDTDLRAFTGQSRHIPMILSQMTSNPPSGQGANVIATAQMLAAQQNRGKIVMVGTKYAYSYADGQHMSNYFPLGEKHAQVIAVLDQDGTWEPTWPIAIVRSGTTVKIYVHVPVPPLVIDGGHTGPHLSGGLSPWASGVGFEAYDARQTITGGTGNGVSPIVLTVGSTANYTNGQTVYSCGSAGNTNANGAYVCTVVDGTHISLNGTTGNGTWASNVFFGTPYIVNVISVGAPTLASVAGNIWSVTFTLGRTPTTGLTIGYADTPDAAYGTLTGGFSGPAFPSGRCGLIRDSDPYVGISGIANQNWLVEFFQAVA